MKWQRGAADNQDVIDERGSSSAGGGGGGFSFPMGTGGRVGGGAGLIGVIVAVAIALLGGGSSGGGLTFPQVQAPFGTGVQSPSGGAIPRSQDPEKDLRDFSAYVFTNVQKTWAGLFEQQGRTYEHAKLVLYRRGVRTACGAASSSAGPFYCPGDQRVYLDLSFYDEMRSSLGASGDFAWAYVIAHEMGHHVQQQLGTEAQVRRLQGDDPSKRNALSVRLELQADCYAGAWAHRVASSLQAGDAEEALGAASAVGDDRLQKQATGQIRPDTFTHGTSEQRVRWFRAGQDSGEPAACDTFSADSL